MSELETTQKWFVAAGHMPAQMTEPDGAQTAFYTGMQIEELSEKLRLILGEAEVVIILERLADEFKRGLHNQAVGAALWAHPEEFLDADMDLIWVTAGSSCAQGADARGAYAEVSRANWDKFQGGVRKQPGTGKILKPENWRGPDLAPFIHRDLKGI